MKGHLLTTVLLAAALSAISNSAAVAAPCLIVTLTGTQGGPQSFNGLAGAGTLVRYGDDANECGAVKLQFDAGRGTTMRLSIQSWRPAKEAGCSPMPIFAKARCLISLRWQGVRVPNT